MISHIITSVCVIDLCNKVIDMFHFLVFNSCWCIFVSMCLVIFVRVFTWKVCFAHGAENNAFSFLRWKKTWPLVVIWIFVFLLWFSFLPRGNWGAHCPHHCLNHNMLVMLVASWLTFSNVLKKVLFVRNADKLEVFWNHNIS